MSTKPPVPMREIIDLLSSSPPPRPTPVPTITKNDESSLTSSSLPPSPSVMFNAVAAAREMQGNKTTSEKVTTHDMLDGAGKVGLPIPATGKKQTSGVTTDARVKKPRARKSTKVEKTVLLKDRKIKSRVVKNAIAQVETKSKFFTGCQEQDLTEMTMDNQLDASIVLNPVSRKAALVPKSPNLEPPLHVIRRQWTPVKNTVLTLDSSSPVDGEPKVTQKAVFGSMIDVMRYSIESTQDSREVSASMDDRFGNGLTNKRAIEMIGLPSAPSGKDKTLKPSKPSKPKLSKSKPRTITDQATASFRSASNPKASPILQFFSPQGETPLNTQDTKTQISFSRELRPPAKKKRKSSPETIILLSPTSAQKRFDDQDFMFGTCSQLEKSGENKAALTRDIRPRISFDGQKDHHDELPPVSTSVVRRDFLNALAKDRKGGSLFGGSREKGQNGVSAGHNNDVYVSAISAREQAVGGGRSRLGKPWRTGCGLWGAAARDLEGGLMDIEVVDMTGSENGDKGCSVFGTVQEMGHDGLSGSKKAATGTQVTGIQAPRNDTGGPCQSIRRETQIIDRAADICDTDPVQAIRNLRDNPWATSSSTASFNATLAAPLGKLASIATRKTKLVTSSVGPGVNSRSVSSRASGAAASLSTLVGTNPTDPISNLLVAPTTKKSIQAKPAPVMPDFQSYPTAQLKAEVAKFGFKNMRTRDRMVSCLERCWEARNKTASDLGQVRNTVEPLERTAEEETVPILQLQEDTTAATQKPKTSTRQKKVVDKAVPKSPKRKAGSSRSKPPPEKTPPPGDSDYHAPEIVSPSAKSNPSKKKTIPAPGPRTRKALVPSPAPQYAASKTTKLHFRISEVVRESGDAKSEFSFYHTILMYDPIVLEDLTQWLNMHMEEKIDVEDVKTWCEANGVCCVRSESLRGKQRKRR